MTRVKHKSHIHLVSTTKTNMSTTESTEDATEEEGLISEDEAEEDTMEAETHQG